MKAGVPFYDRMVSDMTVLPFRDAAADVVVTVDSIHHALDLDDTLKEIRGIDALEPYLLESAAAVESCTVDIGDVAAHDGNYYFRWTMDIRFKSIKKGQLTRSIGISHIRFNKEGKICLHQDYWDSTSGFFQHVPFVGYLIRKIKARI